MAKLLLKVLLVVVLLAPMGGTAEDFPMCDHVISPLPRRKFNVPAPKGPGEEPRKHPLRTDLKITVFARLPEDEHSDGYARFKRSCDIQDVDVIYVPHDHTLGSEKLLGDIADHRGPGNVVMWIDGGSDVLLAGERAETLRLFDTLNASIVFGGQRHCTQYCSKDWPVGGESRFLNTRGFVGFTDVVYEMLSSIEKEDDLYELYLSLESRHAYGLEIDYNHVIFQSLFGYLDDINHGQFEIEFEVHDRPDTRLRNIRSETRPIVIRGDGNLKLLHQIGNYVPLSWTPDDECISCKHPTQICNGPDRDLAVPSLFLALFVDTYSPFLELVLEGIRKQVYPKDHISLYVYVPQGADYKRASGTVNEWLGAVDGLYKKVHVAPASRTVFEAHSDALRMSNEEDADFTLLLDSLHRFSNESVFTHLVSQNRSVITPMMSRDGKLWSNYWGNVAGDYSSQCFDDMSGCAGWAAKGECDNNADWMRDHCPRSCKICQTKGSVLSISYQRSFDFSEITQRKRVGVWNVPLAFGAVMMRKNAASTLLTRFEASAADFFKGELTATEAASTVQAPSWTLAMQVARWLRQDGMHLMISNILQAGTLIDNEGYDITKVHPELYMVDNNYGLWAEWYLHPLYNETYKLEPVYGRCWDVFNFPLVSDKFCDDLVEEAEDYGKWSGGKSDDERLQGGYEPVPTRDIHFKQMGFYEPWVAILKRAVAPIVENEFPSYHLKGEATLDFIVKYTPEGQSSLRPHFDASTFSVNVALNRPFIDFEGGGTRYTRQNCSVTDNQKGWAVIHPGKLTHEHEGLEVTKGTRYILVSFVDQ